jgi:hypothetical protein
MARSMTKVAWAWLCLTASLAFGRQLLSADPFRGGGQSPGDELVGADPAGLRRDDDPGLLQHAQMLDDRRQLHLERLRQFAHRRRPAGQPFDHRTLTRDDQGA